MRFRSTLLWVLVAAVASSADPASANRPFGWTISASPTDPLVNWASPRITPGPVDLYLWYACSSWWIQANAAEMGVAGTLTPVGFTPLNGFVSIGTATELLLGHACAYAPMLAGILTVQDPGGGGTVSFVPSSNNRIITVACGSGMGYTHEWIGFASDGSLPPYDIVSTDVPCLLTGPDPPTSAGRSVESSSWGRVKAIYR
ncbi:MAG TPA: hypothetical protein VKU85_08185 [bacterium]|nr:hypothetical protein [bacterium]